MALQTKDFSVTAKSADGSNTFTYTLRIQENSIDQTLNRSNVTVQAILQQTNSGLCFSNMSAGVSFSLGRDIQKTDYRVRALAGTKEHIYFTWTGDVFHDEDGSLSLEVEGRFWMSGTNAPVPTMQIKKQVMELTPIPVSSVAGASDAYIGSNSTIVLSTAQKDCLYSIKYTFGELTGYIQADGSLSPSEVKFSQNVVSFQVPDVFYSQIPDRKEGNCMLQVMTYRGDTAISKGTTSFRVMADPNVCAPLVEARVVDTDEKTLTVTADENKIVRFMSDAQCYVTTTCKKWAQLRSVTVNGVPIEESLTISNTETGTYSFSATDSRGYTTRLTVEKEFVPYVLLTCNPTARRTAPTTGQVELTLEGNCWQGNFGAGENVLHGRYRVSGEETWHECSVPIEENNTYHTSLLLEGLDYTRNYVLEVELHDLLHTVSATTNVQRGVPVFNWGEDYFNFYVPVHFGAGATGLT